MSPALGARVRRPVAALAAACAVLTSCATDTTADVPSAPALDGTFRVEFGPRTTVSGSEVGDTAGAATWVARTSCGGAGCVATATEAPGGSSGDPKPPTMVFDYVDDGWVSVTEVPAECTNSRGETLAVQGWQTYVLRPGADGTFTGTYTNRSSVGGACRNGTQSVTVTRTGDADPAVAVADPGAEPPREPSPATALRGRYREVQTNPQTGQVYPPTTYSGDTRCLRTGGRCLSYFVDPDSKAILVLVFADGRWTSAGAPTDSPCPDGAVGRSVLTGEYDLPQRLSDPIPRLTGTQRTKQTGPCRGSLTLDVTLDRLGDGAPS